jgi:hypothetical protein
MRSIEPGISRFRVWSCGPSRNDGVRFASLLTMTNTPPHSRGAKRPSCAKILRPEKQRAWGMPDARRTRSLVCAESGKKCTRVFTARSPKSPGIPTQWFTAYGALFPEIGLSCLRRLRKLPSANLTPASRRQNHTSSPSASVPFVIGTSTSTASRPASVTIASRPSGGTRRR